MTKGGKKNLHTHYKPFEKRKVNKDINKISVGQTEVCELSQNICIDCSLAADQNLTQVPFYIKTTGCCRGIRFAILPHPLEFPSVEMDHCALLLPNFAHNMA